MPISTPAIAAHTPPVSMASTRRIVSFSIWKAFSSQPDMMMPEKAPTLMKPA